MSKIREDGHVYFIRLGNSSQDFVKEYAINNKALLIGYDKESSLASLNTCIGDALHEFKGISTNPEDYDPELEVVENIFDNDKKWKCEDKAKLPPRGKKALRRFALARKGIDYFFTFFEKKLYYGTPAEDPRILKDDEQITLSDKQTNEFRVRELEWSCLYDIDNVDPKDEILYKEISGIISRINMFQETLYMLKEEGKTFSERNVFFDVIKKRMPDIVESALKVESGQLPLSSVGSEISDQVKALAVYGRNDRNVLIQNLCNYLNPSAFEIFVDIAYINQGYNRCSELGGTMKAIDMEYLKFHDNSSWEHFAVQVKSRINPNVLEEVLVKINDTLQGLKCYIVTHGDNEDDLEDKIAEFPGNQNHELFELMPFKTLIENTPDTRILLAFLVLHIAGRRKLEELQYLIL